MTQNINNENEKYKTKPESQSVSDTESSHFVGLKNQGATCYMNCILQALFHLPIFRHAILQAKIEKDEKILEQLQYLFRDLESNIQNAVSTKSLTQSFGWHNNDESVPQDPHQFLHWLIVDILMKNNESFIKDIFEGILITSITREDSDKVKNIKEFFYDLSMIVKKCNSLEQSFARYIEPDYLKNEHLATIDPREKAATKITIRFLKFPKVLFLHLNRTEFNFRSEKIKSYFSFNENLNISPYLCKNNYHSGSTIYKLYGVIVHHGSLATDGHYYVFLKPSEIDGWHKFNDSFIHKSSINEAIDNNYGGKNTNYILGCNLYKSFSAYILVYIQESEISSVFNPEYRHHIQTVIKRKTENIQITLINERSFVLNLLRGYFDFRSNELNLTIVSNIYNTISEFYLDIASQLRLNSKEFRIWTLDKNQRFISALNCSDGFIVKDIMKSEFFYIEMLAFPEHPIDARDKIIFISFFFRIDFHPIRFQFHILIKENESLMYVFQQLITSLGTKEKNPDNFICYKYVSNQLFEIDNLFPIDTIVQKNNNGDLYFFQYKTPVDLSPPTFYKAVPNQPNNYFYLLEHVATFPFKHINEYFDIITQSIEIDFSDEFHYIPNTHIVTPLNIKIKYLILLISKLSKVKSFHLFAPFLKNPINFNQFETVFDFCHYIIQNNNNHVPHLFITPLKKGTLTYINSIYSDDAIHSKEYKRVFVNTEKTYIFNDLISPHFLSNKLKNDIRVISIKDKKIISIKNIDQEIDLDVDWIRFEVIPISQRIKCNGFQKFCQCRFIGNILATEKLPFLIIIEKNDTISDFRIKVNIPSTANLYHFQNGKSVPLQDQNLFSLVSTSSVLLIKND